MSIEISEEILERLKRNILEIDTDFKVEVYVSALIKYGIHPDQIIIEPHSNSKRSYRKEVSGFHTELLSYDNKEYIFLHTHRDGLYDALPENIFHQPIRGRTEKNKYEIIDEIKKHREEEKAARKFFLPFEYDYNHIKAQLYRIEEDFEKNISNSKLIEIFSAGWPILKRLDTYHAYIFLRMIPLIHSIRNDFDLVSKSVSLILGIPVHIKLCRRDILRNLHGSFSMGNGRLGIDTIIGSVANDGETDIMVEVGPISSHLLGQYIEGGKHEGLIDEVLDYFVGANYYIYKEYIPELEKGFVLEDNLVILGANSQL